MQRDRGDDPARLLETGEVPLEPGRYTPPAEAARKSTPSPPRRSDHEPDDPDAAEFGPAHLAAGARQLVEAVRERAETETALAGAEAELAACAVDARGAAFERVTRLRAALLQRAEQVRRLSVYGCEECYTISFDLPSGKAMSAEEEEDLGMECARCGATWCSPCFDQLERRPFPGGRARDVYKLCDDCWDARRDKVLSRAGEKRAGS